MNDFRSINIDEVFNGANAVLGAAYNASNALVDGWNNLKSNAASRRNFNGSYGYGQYGNYGYGYGGGNYCQPPVNYGYGYADYSYPPNAYPQMNGYPSGYMNQGYFGFTDPTYGMSQSYGGYPQNNGGPVLDMMPNNAPHPQGGAWGL